MIENKISRNIPALFVIRVSMWFMVLMPVIIPFFESKALNIQEILMLTGIHSLTIALFEIPSGYLADRWGRKKSLMVGCLLFFLGYLGFCFSLYFIHFAIAQVALGIANSFISGSDSALLYDSLLGTKQKDRYTQLEGQNYAIGNVAEAVAAIAGGLLASLSLDAPLYAQTFMAFIAVPASFFLIEVHKNSLIEDTPSKVKQFLIVLKNTFQRKLPVSWLIYISACTGVLTLSMAWMAQPLFEDAGIPLKFYGILWAFLNLLSAYGSLRAYRVKMLVSEKWFFLILLITLSFGLCFLYITTSWFLFIPICLHYIARGLTTPILRSLIQDEVSSDYRATIMSIRSFIIRVAYGITAPLLGWFSLRYNERMALFVLGLCVGVLVLILFRKYLAIRRKI